MGDIFYPIGGWEDFSASFQSIDEAINHIVSQDSYYKWGHIVCDGKIICKFIDLADPDAESNWGVEDIS